MDGEALARWVGSGRIVDVILLVIACEAAALAVYHRATGGGVSVRDGLPNLASGACLLLALRCALVSAPWQTVVAAVCAALVAHVCDLARRWSPNRAGATSRRNN